MSRCKRLSFFGRKPSINVFGNSNRVFILFFCLGIVLLQGCATNVGGFIENDVLAPEALFGRNQDRNLTQTTAISFTGTRSAIASRSLLRKFDSGLQFVLPFLQECRFRSSSKSELGTTVFTPDDLDSFIPVFVDRPYASLLYATTARILHCGSVDALNLPANTALRTSLTLGLLGAGLAEDTQRWLHITAGVSPRIPNGWGNQISDGGEPTFMYSVERQALLIDSRVVPGIPLLQRIFKRAQLSYSVGARLGYYTDLSLGIDLRILLNNSIFCSEFYDIGGARLDSGVEGQREDCNRSDRFLFAGARTRGIFYNSLMQGQFRGNPHELSSDEVEDVVTTYTAGASDTLQSVCRLLSLGQYLFRCSGSGLQGTRVTFAVHQRTAEYDLGVKGRKHAWGGLYLSRGVN